MKAVRFMSYGKPEVLELFECPISQPGEGELLIKIHSAGVSRPDYLMRTGIYPWTKGTFPFYPGLYASGTVAALGPNVGDFSVGQSVFVDHPIVCGCYSEYKLAPIRFVSHVPEGTDLDQCSVLTNYFIAWGMLTEGCKCRTGDTLYISGAAGSIGTAILQLAPLLGVKVIASASTQKKCDYLKSLGTAEVFCYTTEDPSLKIAEVTDGRGVDFVLDQCVGSDFAKQLELLAPMGTILIYNHLKGFPEQSIIQSMTSNFANCPAVRVFSFHYFDDKPELLRKKKDEVFEFLSQGKIKPQIFARFAPEQVRDAHTLLDSGDFIGSIILKP
jgi:NADPH2:quinone reductase